jgi:hypothetical protein
VTNKAEDILEQQIIPKFIAIVAFRLMKRDSSLSMSIGIFECNISCSKYVGLVVLIHSSNSCNLGFYYSQPPSLGAVNLEV